MKYSEQFLTDDNFDEELEKLAELIGIPHTNYEKFEKELDSKFKEQTHSLGFSEWLKSGIYSNPNSLDIYEKGFLAYEFANGFIIFNFDLLI